MNFPWKTLLDCLKIWRPLPAGARHTRPYHIANLFYLALTSALVIAGYHPYHFWPGVFVAPLAFYFILHRRRPSPRARFWYGLWFGLMIVIMGFPWLTHTLKVFGGVPEMVAYLLYFLYAIFFNLKFPLYFILIGYLSRTRLPAWFLYSGLFVVCEYFSVELFPWTFSATQARNLVFIQSADLIGVYGLTFLIFASSFLVLYTWTWARHRLRSPRNSGRFWARTQVGVALMAALLIGNIAYGLVQLDTYRTRVKDARRYQVGIVQPNAPLQFKGKNLMRELNRIIRRVERLARDAEGEARRAGRPLNLLVIPEGAVPYLSTNPGAAARSYYYHPLHSMVLRLVRDLELPVFINEIDVEFRPRNEWPAGASRRQRRRYYNSSVLMNLAGDRASNYRKNFLMPFGEYFPLPNIFGLEDWLLKNTNMSNFSRGSKKFLIEAGHKTAKEDSLGTLITEESPREIKKNWPAENLVADRTLKFLPLICYEILSGRYVRDFENAHEADFIVNVTNDRWFNPASKESGQHLQLGLFRAIEMRKTVVRSTNSGTSALILPTGEIPPESIIENDRSDNRRYAVPRFTEKTLFSRFGNWFVYLLGAFFLAFGVIQWWRRRQKA